MGLSRSQNVEQRFPEERRSGKNLLQIKWRTFSGPALTHEHTHKVTHTDSNTQIYTSYEGIPEAVLPTAAFQGWVNVMCPES